MGGTKKTDSGIVPESLDQVGTLIGGKYKLLCLIGEGGMGAVFEAKHTGTERLVALKFLREELAGDEEALERFEREAKAAGRIDNDNICEVYDYGVEDGAPYLVMPLLKGEPLDEVIRRQAPMSVERVCDIGAQTLSALAAAHAIGLVHRDLKPENVFLTTVGDRQDFVKVLDFGISKSLSKAGSTRKEKTLTSEGTILGTPYYMAPEQARGMKIDGRIDLYAMGVILYEMLTGHRPIKGSDIHEILTNIFFTPIPLPRSLRKDLPEALEAIVLKAMTRDLDERFHSAGAMRKALLDALERPSRPSAVTIDTLEAKVDEARTPSRPEPAATPAGETSGVLSPTASAADDRQRDAFADTLGESISTPKPTVTSYETASPHRRWSLTPLVGGLAVAVVAVASLAAWFALGREDQGPEPFPHGEPTRVAASLGDEAEGAGPQAPVSPPDEEPPAAVPADASAAAEGEGDEVAVPAEEPTPTVEVAEADTVRITLEDLPEGASVLADDRPVAGPAFDVPRSDRPVRIVVRAEGYRSWHQLVEVREPATVTVQMQRRGREGQPRDVAAPSPPRPRPESPSPPANSPVSSFGEMP